MKTCSDHIEYNSTSTDHITMNLLLQRVAASASALPLRKSGMQMPAGCRLLASIQVVAGACCHK